MIRKAMGKMKFAAVTTKGRRSFLRTPAEVWKNAKGTLDNVDAGGGLLLISPVGLYNFERGFEGAYIQGS